MAVKCSAIAKSGSRCDRPALAGGAFCLMHSPDHAEMRREASRKGGRARSNQARAAKAMPAALTGDELLALLSACLRRVEAGTLEAGPANAIAGLAKAITAIRESTDTEARLAELEARAGLADGRRAA